MQHRGRFEGPSNGAAAMLRQALRDVPERLERGLSRFFGRMVRPCGPWAMQQPVSLARFMFFYRCKPSLHRCHTTEFAFFVALLKNYLTFVSQTVRGGAVGSSLGS